MPSRLHQQVIIISGRRRNDGTHAPDIIAIKKTGYLNFWYNGQHFYYNHTEENVDPNKIDIQQIINNMQADENKKRGFIVIRRK